MSRLQANMLLLAVAAIWGFAFVMQSRSMDAIGPLWFVGLRFLIASLIALPLAIAESRKTDVALGPKNIIGFSVIGLALFLGSAVQQFGLLTTTVTNSGFLTALYVVFVPILSLLFLRKVPHWIIWPAALLALFGIFLLSGGRFEGFSYGDSLTILCAGFFAIQLLLIGVLVGDSKRPMTLCLFQFVISGVAGVVAASFLEPIDIGRVMTRWPEIVFTGVFSSGFGFIGQVVGQRYTTAPQAAIFLCSESLFAALFGALLLGESIQMVGYIGCGLIFAALIAVEIIPELTKTQATSAKI